MNLKININKVHGSLCDLFGEVSVTERSNREKGNYFEIVAESNGMTAVIEIEKAGLESSYFEWGYYPNPEERGHLVERKSSVDSIAADVMDIFEKKRFDGEYLSKISK